MCIRDSIFIIELFSLCKQRLFFLSYIFSIGKIRVKIKSKNNWIVEREKVLENKKVFLTKKDPVLSLESLKRIKYVIKELKMMSQFKSNARISSDTETFFTFFSSLAGNTATTIQKILLIISNNVSFPLLLPFTWRILKAWPSCYKCLFFYFYLKKW